MKRIAAPPAWRAIDFISDIHLSAAQPRTFEAWRAFLAGTDADAVFILGDLFEVWVGDDARASGAFEAACAGVLQSAARRMHVAFMAGNRDFLVGPALLDDCGITALPDPVMLDAWGSPVLLNACEMQWIADNLFVGNKLTSGEIHTSAGVRVDLRNIRSSIIVLCSWGDNITPPQQALGWITDLYERDDEIVTNGQTIVYTLHQTIGHLGIFVSGKVATKEHAEFASCMEMIDLLPPGLYEAVITEVDDNTVHADLVHGKYLFRLEARSLDDIRALGGNSEEDNKRFAAAARVSEVNHGLYRTFAQPAVQALSNSQSADLMRQLNPSRLRFAAFSDRNPAMQPVKALADAVRADRKPVSADNPLHVMEQVASTWITTCWESYRLARDAMTEAMFLGTYGSPVLQAMVGQATPEAPTQRRIERDLAREAIAARAQADLEKRFEVGGLAEAVIRAIMHVRLPERTVDERGFAVLQAIRRLQPANRRRSLGEIKTMFREQYMLLRLDEERAVRAIPRLLPDDEERRVTGWKAVTDVLAASGALPDDGRRRLERLRELFAAPGRPSTKETDLG